MTNQNISRLQFIIGTYRYQPMFLHFYIYFLVNEFYFAVLNTLTHNLYFYISHCKLSFSRVIFKFFIVRSPSYVYSELAPSSSSESRISVNEKALRPLPSTISMGQYIDADIVPKHMATTIFYIINIILLVDLIMKHYFQ
uniref:Uncharacterized protein n=1 Tax=Heterorhabditis bacteriophora TaxID=37862 RepID=A0A1I7WA37_HETBA